MHSLQLQEPCPAQPILLMHQDLAEVLSSPSGWSNGMPTNHQAQEMDIRSHKVQRGCLWLEQVGAGATGSDASTLLKFRPRPERSGQSMNWPALMGTNALLFRAALVA